jgi:hypothetical protein
MRLRILVGTLALVLGLAVYALTVTRLALWLLPDQGWAAAALLYAVAGTVWILPAARLTRWMQRAAPFRPPPSE